MNYFLDTNVKLGYVFCTDPWNDNSISVFNNNDFLYDSKEVYREFNRKYHYFLNEQKHFFYGLKDVLELDNSSKEISLKDLLVKAWTVNLKHEFDDNKKESCVKTFWKFCRNLKGLNNDLDDIVFKINDIINYISRFLMGFERGVLNRKLQYELKVMCHSKRTMDYEEIYDKLIESNVHNPDTFIILDAHDLSITDSIVLDFITGDYDMIQNLNEIINCLNINKFHYLKDFNQ